MLSLPFFYLLILFILAFSPNAFGFGWDLDFAYWQQHLAT